MVARWGIMFSSGDGVVGIVFDAGTMGLWREGATSGAMFVGAICIGGVEEQNMHDMRYYIESRQSNRLKGLSIPNLTTSPRRHHPSIANFAIRVSFSKTAH